MKVEGKKENWDGRAKRGNKNEIGVLTVIGYLCARPVSGGNTIWGPGLFKLLKPPKKRAFGGSEAM